MANGVVTATQLILKAAVSGANYTSMGLASSAALAAAAGYSGYVGYDGAAVAVAWQPNCSAVSLFPLCFRVRSTRLSARFALKPFRASGAHRKGRVRLRLQGQT